MQTKDIPEQEIIEACEKFHRGEGETPDIALAEKYPEKVVLAKMGKMCDRGILEYGVSLRTAWVINNLAD